MEFFESLYKGFEAEYYVAGKLFSVGYEAFKLPGDFGFDLIVTNQKELSMGPRQEGRLIEPPFAIQVKCRSLRSSDFQTTASGRDEARVSISIKKEYLDLLIGAKNNFLVIVLFVQGDARRFEERTVHFWLGSDHVNALLEPGYFIPDEADRRVRNLMCSLRMLPMLSVVDVLDELMSQNHLTQEGKRILASELPDRVPRSWKASEYVALARRARNAPHELVWRQVPQELFDLRNMGFDIGLDHLDKESK
jgi:hypothetical protein